MRVTQVSRIYESKYLNVSDASFVDKLGQNKHWFYAQRPDDTKYVFIVPIVYKVPQGAKTFQAKPKLVVIREYRVPVGGYVYSFPAGLIDPTDFSAIDSARRELHQETGLDLKWVTETSPTIFSSPGLTDEKGIIFYVEAEGEISTEFQEPSEDIEPMLLDREDALILLRDKENLFDAKAYPIMRIFANYGVI